MGFFKNLFGSLASIGGAVTTALTGKSDVGQAVGAGLSTLGGISAQQSAQESSLKQTQLFNQGQLDLMNAQNSWNLDQWNRENIYNSPIEQRKRLETAGLNPLFVGIDGNTSGTGLQSATAGLESGAQSVQTGQSAFANQIQAQQLAQQSALLASQKANLDADTVNKHKQAGKTEKETSWIDRLNSAIEQREKATSNLNTSMSQYYQKSIDNLMVEKEKIISETKVNENKAKELDEIVRWMPLLNKAQLQQVQEGINEMRSRIRVNSAEYIRLRALEGLIHEQELSERENRKLIKANTSSIEEDARGKSITNDVREETLSTEIFKANAENSVGTVLDLAGSFVGTVGNTVNIADKLKPSQTVIMPNKRKK